MFDKLIVQTLLNIFDMILPLEMQRRYPAERAYLPAYLEQIAVAALMIVSSMPKHIIQAVGLIELAQHGVESGAPELTLEGVVQRMKDGFAPMSQLLADAMSADVVLLMAKMLLADYIAKEAAGEPMQGDDLLRASHYFSGVAMDHYGVRPSPEAMRAETISRFSDVEAALAEMGAPPAIADALRKLMEFANDVSDADTQVDDN